jgi:hypothetical protein
MWVCEHVSSGAYKRRTAGGEDRLGPLNVCRWSTGGRGLHLPILVDLPEDDQGDDENEKDQVPKVKKCLKHVDLLNNRS